MNLLLIVAAVWHVMAVKSFMTHPFQNDLHYAVAKISENEIRFSLELYKALAKVKMGFFSVSTADVFLGLSMLYYGAEGRSREQLNNVLNYSPDCTITRLAVHNLARRLEQLDDYDSMMTNAIVCTDQLHIEDDFKTKVDEIRTSEWLVEFGKDLERDKAITDWIDKVKYGLLDQLITEREDPFSLISVTSLTPHHYLRQLNASVADSVFHYNNGYSVMEKFVKSSSELIYGEFNYRRHSNDDYVVAQYIKLPWEHTGYSKFKTIIILPNDRDGITELEQNINEATISEMLSKTDMTLISVLLPVRLIIDKIMDITEAFKHMDLSELFKETTDFEKISKTRPLMLGQVISTISMSHHMIFDAEPIMTLSTQVQKSFNADHPFIILTVLEDDNPVILSMARYGWVPGVSKADGQFRDDY